MYVATSYCVSLLKRGRGVKRAEMDAPHDGNSVTLKRCAVDARPCGGVVEDAAAVWPRPRPPQSHKRMLVKRPGRRKAVGGVEMTGSTELVQAGVRD